MLVLTLELEDGGVWIGDDIRIELVKVNSTGQCRIGFDVPEEILILRDKLRRAEIAKTTQSNCEEGGQNGGVRELGPPAKRDEYSRKSDVSLGKQGTRNTGPNP